MSPTHKKSGLLTLFVLSMLAAPALAVPTKVVHQDTPDCDPLFIPLNVHEIGDVAVFPSNEALFATDLGPTQQPACLSHDSTLIPNVVVSIRNLSGIDWAEVWYVADQETTISNYDGEANDVNFAPLRAAFRIDHSVSDPGGLHHALIAESGLFDGIWQNGETWDFILQDYFNSAGLLPSALDSIGVGDASSNTAGFVSSSGSIIAIAQVPEPTTCLLLLVGLATTALQRRKS